MSIEGHLSWNDELRLLFPWVERRRDAPPSMPLKVDERRSVWPLVRPDLRLDVLSSLDERRISPSMVGSAARAGPTFSSLRARQYRARGPHVRASRLTVEEYSGDDYSKGRCDRGGRASGPADPALIVTRLVHKIVFRRFSSTFYGLLRNWKLP